MFLLGAILLVPSPICLLGDLFAIPPALARAAKGPAGPEDSNEAEPVLGIGMRAAVSTLEP